MRLFATLTALGLLTGCPVSQPVDTDTDIEPVQDADGDGFSTDEGDCDDGIPAINPAETDIAGDGIDQNCDGTDGTDMDGDGDPNVASGGTDCDDTDASVLPGTPDTVGDGIDNDCDGADGVDLDADGFASTASGGDDCDDDTASTFPAAGDLTDDGVDNNCDGIDGVDGDGDGWASQAGGGDDCDDTDGDTYPGADDTLGDGIDQSCDGIDGLDADEDGYAAQASGGQDCDDTIPGINPAAPDLADDGLDQNCDGLDGIDGDQDGYASVGSGGLDCNDGSVTIFPGADELCDGINDDNCDGTVDEDSAVDAPVWYSDIDEDTYGDPASPVPSCLQKAGTVANQADCNDGDSAINPDADEVTYNGVDEDCDALTLDDDLDGDGYVLADDCRDNDATINPGAAEIYYDDLDNDCDNNTQDRDQDGDGYHPDLWDYTEIDCDDTDASISPRALEIMGDGIDQNCGDDGDDAAWLWGVGWKAEHDRGGRTWRFDDADRIELLGSGERVMLSTGPKRQEYQTNAGGGGADSGPMTLIMMNDGGSQVAHMGVESQGSSDGTPFGTHQESDFLAKAGQTFNGATVTFNLAEYEMTPGEVAHVLDYETYGENFGANQALRFIDATRTTAGNAVALGCSPTLLAIMDSAGHRASLSGGANGGTYCGLEYDSSGVLHANVWSGGWGHRAFVVDLAAGSLTPEAARWTFPTANDMHIRDGELVVSMGTQGVYYRDATTEVTVLDTHDVRSADARMRSGTLHVLAVVADVTGDGVRDVLYAYGDPTGTLTEEIVPFVGSDLEPQSPLWAGLYVDDRAIWMGVASRGFGGGVLSDRVGWRILGF